MESPNEPPPDLRIGQGDTNTTVTGDNQARPELGKDRASGSDSAGAGTRKEKGRVRFNSRAGVAGVSVQDHAAHAAHASHVASNVDPTSSRALPDFQDIRIRTSDGDFVSSNDAIPLRDLPTARGNAWQRIPPDDGEQRGLANQEAHRLVQDYTSGATGTRTAGHATTHNGSNGATSSNAPRPELSEVNDGNYDGLYEVSPPKEYRGNILSQLLKLYKPATAASAEPLLGLGQSTSRNSGISSPGDQTPTAPGSSHGNGGTGTGTGGTTPMRRKWYEQNRSQDTLYNLVEASARLAVPNNEPSTPPSSEQKADGKKRHRPLHKRTASSSRFSAFLQAEEEQHQQQEQQQQQQQQHRITVHIAETISRQDYIIKLCRALMLFGAPTHRLEEYLSTTAQILEIDGQFLYLPGCMIISFDDKPTRTAEVSIVRTAQGIDLGRLQDTHQIYKEVIHDVIGAEEGAEKLDLLVAARVRYHPWLRVLVFGLTSAACGPFSFSARLIDIPLAFCFGCLVGVLQLIVAPKSLLYSNVLEVSATVLVSFLARAFGSINDGKLFCFSAIAQSGIVMLLPGYAVLCSALELQSRAIVPGSIRIVYAIIYSLFLGFGITVGAALYGVMDSNATSSTTCEDPLPPYYRFVFVPLFVLCISILYQARWRQMPVMVVVAFAGYVVSFFTGRRFVAAPQVAPTLGALTVGVLANLHSRVRHGVAAATLIPAIFTQVPGGLASTGGLLSGLSTANLITNATQAAANGTTAPSSPFETGSENLNAVVFNVAASMIQIAIGIAVGLFMSALIIYPLGKRRSGLFSF
ncbi:DUF1212-domain-containing protein [Sodiomyces alkalinus F11]|uniref:DUF1212-domain-containing protein n=1 Tax=Sodiomyces alkalinus (strain CBS 110278 / VKM F-3762 / F11) TaxID=1314773 RepID=A0A3N2PUU7_SODAK|nr:DUF1212-domain-containing protein [Sodiomyces alkalinus F11]ROT38244.1 DUF1212-domain-containing protein [Sodiomyces alkalinus F11]